MKILVIDDEPGIRTLLAEILGRAGFEIIEASDGDEGIRLFREFTPPVIITDIVMPGKTGIEIIMEIRRMDPKVKFIVISGGGHVPAEKYLNLADALNVEYTFEKPLKSEDQLVEAVRSLAREPEAV